MDLENTVIVVWSLLEARDFSLPLSVQTNIRTHAASYSVSTEGYFH
jgi:hypothetical protein